MRLQSKLLRASDPDQVKSLVDYVRMNISRLSSVFIRPLGYQDVEQELQEEFGFSPEVAELICPVVNQRVDKTLNDSQFKRALEVSLNSAPAQTLLKKRSSSNPYYVLRSAKGLFPPMLIQIHHKDQVDLISMKLRKQLHTIGDIDFFGSDDPASDDISWILWSKDFDYENNEDHEQGILDRILAQKVKSVQDIMDLDLPDEEFLKLQKAINN